jgi:hypothetical protein
MEGWGTDYAAYFDAAITISAECAGLDVRVT